MKLRMEQLGGIVPPLITPLLEDESLDEQGLINLVHYNLESGVHGLFALGSTSEGVAVSRKVWRRTTEIVLREAGGKVPVYCGAIECSTAKVIEDLKELEQMGAQIASAVPHFYMVHFSPPGDVQSQVIRHFEKICRETDMKLMVYGMTPGTHVDLKTETMKEIAQIDNVVAFKDTRPDWGTHLHNLIELKETGVCIFSGGEEFLAASFLSGSHGNIAAFTNLFPKLFIEVYDAVKAGNIAKVNELQERVVEIKKAVGGSTWLSGLKYMGVKRKLFKTDTVCIPMKPLTDEDRRQLDIVIEKYC